MGAGSWGRAGGAPVHVGEAWGEVFSLSLAGSRRGYRDPRTGLLPLFLPPWPSSGHLGHRSLTASGKALSPPGREAEEADSWPLSFRS